MTSASSMNEYQSVVISVIVIAHNRKNFILEALKSLLKQTLDRKLFEIIVVKNFKDQFIDEYIEKNSIVSILCNYDSIGMKMSVGILASKGNILSFLEDDDRFLENKLNIIYEEFENNDSLVLYRNEYIRVNGFEQSLDLQRNSLKEQIKLDCLSISKKEMAHILNRHLDIYQSTMSIRKFAILPFLSNIEKIQRGPDIFWIYSAISTKGEIIFSPKILTIITIHGNNTASTNVTQNIKTLIENRTLLILYLLFDYKNIMSLPLNELILKFVKNSIFRWQLETILYCDNSYYTLSLNKSSVIRSLIEFHFKFNIPLLLLFIIVSVFPKKLGLVFYSFIIRNLIRL